MNKKSECGHLFPISVEVKAGQTYLWCSCGKTQKPPFCDRNDCGDKAVPFQATLNEELSFCNCKQTKTPPFCDGSHAGLLMEWIKKNR